MNKKIILVAITTSLLQATLGAAQAFAQPNAGEDNVAFASSGKSFTCDYLPADAKASVYIPYALCWNVVCDTAGPTAKKATCKCDIYNGPSWGTVPCAERAAAYQAKNQIIYSEFSARYLLKKPGMQPVNLPAEIEQIKPITVCHNDQHLKNFRYVDCWNKLCTPNPDGKTATCACEVIYPLANPIFMTEADNCSDGASACIQYSGKDKYKVVNGSPLDFGPPIVSKSLDYYVAGGRAAAHNYFEAAQCQKDINVVQHH